MYSELGISEEVLKLVNKCEEDCLKEFKKIDDIWNKDEKYLLQELKVDDSCPLVVIFYNN